MNNAFGLQIVEFAKKMEGTEVTLHRCSNHQPQEPGKDWGCFALVSFTLSNLGQPLPEGIVHVRDLYFDPSIGRQIGSIEALICGDLIFGRRDESPLPNQMPSYIGIYDGQGVIHNSYLMGRTEIWTAERFFERYQFFGARRLHANT